MLALKPRVRIRVLACLVLLASALPGALDGQAQTAQGPGNNHPANQSNCAVRTAPMSAGEIALARGEYAQAVDAFSSAMKSPGADAARAHNGRIRALLAAGKISDAEADANSWSASAPEAWSRVSMGEVQLREGEIPEAYGTLQGALNADSCNARTRADLARVYGLTGMFATAKRLLDSAHALDPIDDEIELAWIESQPAPAQSDELGKYMDRATSYLSESQKADLVQRQKRLALAMTDTCRLTTPFASTMIPYNLVDSNVRGLFFWGLDLTIDGKQVRLFEDSSLSGILLKKSVAASLHLQPIDGVEVGGIHAQPEGTVTVAKAHTIQIGPLSFENCDVQVARDEMRYEAESPSARLHDAGLDWPADGVIGANAFRDFLLTLDKPGRQFKLDPLPKPPNAATEPVALITGAAPDIEPMHDQYVDAAMKDWSRVFRSDYLMIFPVLINSGPSRLYSMATNSTLNTISLSLAKQMDITRSLAHEMPSGAGHNSGYYMTTEVTLQFLGMREPVDHMSALDLSNWSQNNGIEITGMLGRPMLDQFTVHLDYRDDLMRLDYDPKRLSHCPPDLKLPSCL
jgi:tetratricopeptide (TPR) repeat protein